jgi:glutaconate CoA-transferase subunit B
MSSSIGGDESVAAYEPEELMIAVLASTFEDGDQVTNGVASHIPVCAIQLARMTHAPGLTWIAGGAGLDPRSHPLPPSTFEPILWQDAVMYFDQGDFWNYVASQRYLQKFCVGAAQIDQFGNMNNTVIGDYHHPKVRLPGTAGLADMGSMPKRLLYWVNDHSPRTLVERVDFRSAIGFLGGSGERARLGLAGGPELVVTNLAVFDFAPDSQRMRLRSLHPGVTLDEVLDATGFEPVIPDSIGTTAAPSAEQIRLIREVIDPQGWRRHQRRPR